MRKIKIVLISGKQGSGKSSLANGLLLWAQKSNWYCKIFKFADPLYEMHDECLAILKDRGVEVPNKDGALLQILGTEWGRKNYGEDIWARLCRSHVDDYSKFLQTPTTMPMGRDPNPGLIIVDDCRFVNEAQIFPDAITVRLEATREARKMRCDSWRENEDHPSETGFDGVQIADYFSIVLNTGPLAFSEEETLAEIVKEILK